MKETTVHKARPGTICNLYQRLFLSFFFISLMSCFENADRSYIDSTIVKAVEPTLRPPTKPNRDSTVRLFDDNSYLLILHIFDSANDFDAGRNNAVLTFAKLNGDQREIFFRDSMFCMRASIDFQDFDNDKVNDVLIFHYTGARANPTYYLYLTDQKNHHLIPVKGFEELTNPFLDTSNNIISSIALSGSNYYSFYRIKSNNKLINLGHGYKDNPNDSNQYERTVSQIIKESK